MQIVNKWWDGTKWHVVNKINLPDADAEMLCGVQAENATTELGAVDSQGPADQCANCLNEWDNRGWQR